MKFNDALWGALFIIFSIVVLVHIQPFPKIPGQNVGPAVFPGLISAGIGICGLILVVRGLRARRSTVATDHAHGAWMWMPPWLKSGRHLTAFLVLVAINVFYVLAVGTLGFIPTGFLYLLAFMWVLRVRWVVAAPVSLLMTFLIHYAFYKLLRVPLPWGLLTNYTW